MSRPSLIFYLAIVAASSANAFTVSISDTRSTTHLHLVPEQGQQLVAAFEASSIHNDEDEDGIQVKRSAEAKSSLLMAKPKGFVSRIFSIPGAIMGRHPAAAPALVDLPREEKSGDDVVLYPIVGFQFVRGGQHALPTTTNASCRISKQPDEEVYGWFTKACSLDSIYSDTYCEEPKTKVLFESPQLDTTEEAM